MKKKIKKKITKNVVGIGKEKPPVTSRNKQVFKLKNPNPEGTARPNCSSTLCKSGRIFYPEVKNVLDRLGNAPSGKNGSESLPVAEKVVKLQHHKHNREIRSSYGPRRGQEKELSPSKKRSTRKGKNRLPRQKKNTSKGVKTAQEKKTKSRLSGKGDSTPRTRPSGLTRRRKRT